MADTVSIHTEIEQERKAAQPDAALLRVFRAYARGRQRGTLTPGQQRMLRGLLGNLFADNICGMVLQQISNRVLLSRFAVAASDVEQAQAQAVEDYLRGLWTFNQLPALSAAVHFAMLRDGNHAIGLAWDQGDQRVRLTRERWWNGKAGVFVAYDDFDQPRYAVKDWATPEGQRRTIWYGDRIERYIGRGSGWQPYMLPSDENQWPKPWTDARGRPLGIPVVHFANRVQPNDGDQKHDPAPQYGMSVLDGGVLGLQDEINDVQRDISAAARFAGYQMFYGTGLTPQRDPDGNEKPIVVEPGAFFRDESPHAKFGTLQAGSLAELERTLTIKLQAVSRATSVPQHLIAGDWPSGEALLRAERPLIDLAEALGRVVGPAWASVAHKATVLANAFASTGLHTDLLISAVFAPAERRDPLTRAQIASAEAPYVSRRQTLRTLGYAPDEQTRILAELAEDARHVGLGQADLVNVLLAKRQLGVDQRTALAELGYTDAQITAMRDAAETDSAQLGDALLTAFDRGR